MEQNNNIIIFNIHSPAIKHLCSIDKELERLINLTGEYKLTLRKDYFRSLVISIIGQQLSVAAAKTISSRLTALYQEITPHNLLNTREEVLRQVGISYSKISYIQDLSRKVLDNKIDLDSINQFEDEEVIKHLTTVKGIGRWTAEMFLIFSLGRLNIMSTKDVGLKRGIKWLYHLDTTPSDEYLMKLHQLWSPYSSVASLYIWDIVNKGFKENATV